MAVKKKWKEALLFLPNFYIFLALSVGISLYMVIGVLEGYFGKVSEFVRTPKYNINSKVNIQKKQDYAFKKEQNIAFLEFFVLCYGLFTLILGCYYVDFFIINYGLIIFLGYSLKLFFPKYIFKF